MLPMQTNKIDCFSFVFIGLCTILWTNIRAEIDVHDHIQSNTCEAIVEMVGLVSATPRPGAVVDFGDDYIEEVLGPPRLPWIMARAEVALRGSDEVLRASRPIGDGVTTSPGLYFLIWNDLICYVGQGYSIYHRVMAHADELRPIDRVATICGLPKWAQTEIEYAYVRAWDLPWNAESTRCGCLTLMPEVSAMAASLDRSAVMPWFTPTVTKEHMSWPKWRLHVLGRLQAREAGTIPWFD